MILLQLPFNRKVNCVLQLPFNSQVDYRRSTAILFPANQYFCDFVSRGWTKASACRLQITLSCAVLCHIVSLQYLSRSSLHRLTGLPCRIFLSVICSPSGGTRGPSVVFEAVDMPCLGPFHFFSQCTLYLCPLSSP